jgi:FkbM family methyltransferase
LLIKAVLRDALPHRIQVPLRFWIKWLRGTIEIEVFAINSIVSKNALVVDVGANRGEYSYLFVQMGLSVRCFEPNVECADVLTGWAKREVGVDVYNVALSERPGIGVLLVPVDADGVVHDSSGSLLPKTSHENRAIDVELDALDNYNIDDVDLIKIDVEGFEDRVIRGALETIKRCRPAIIAEIEERHGGGGIGRVVRLMNDLGYEGFCIHENRMQNVNQLINLGERDHGMVSVPGGINNFIFLCRGRLSEGSYSELLRRKIGGSLQWIKLPFQLSRRVTR